MTTVVPGHDEVGREQGAAGLVEEAEVVGGVTRRVDGAQGAVAGGNPLVVGDRLPGHRVRPVAFRPRHLPEGGVGPARGDRLAAVGVVLMGVGDEHLGEPVRSQRLGQRRQVSGLAGGGVDQRRRPPRQQVGVVAGAGHRAGVEAGDADDLHGEVGVVR